MLKFCHEWHQGHATRMNNLPITKNPYRKNEADDYQPFEGSLVACGSKYFKWRRGWWSANYECTNEDEMRYRYDDEYRAWLAYMAKIAYNRGLSDPLQRNMFLDAKKPHPLLVRSFERGCRDAKTIY